MKDVPATNAAHGSQGSLPAEKKSPTLRVETTKRGPICCTTIHVDTSRGPLHVLTCIDERHVLHALEPIRRFVQALGIRLPTNLTATPEAAPQAASEPAAPQAEVPATPVPETLPAREETTAEPAATTSVGEQDPRASEKGP